MIVSIGRFASRNPIRAVSGQFPDDSQGRSAIRVRRSSGYILAPVMLMLSLVAVVSYLVSFEGTLNTGATARDLEAARARFVAEAGYSEAKWRLDQNTTCAGYASLPPTAFGLHSYAAAITPTTGSPVTFTALGSLSSGGRSTFEKIVPAYQAPIVLVLQPGAAGEDTFVWDGANDSKNFGTATKISVNNASKERTSLLRFDLSTIPPGKIVSAALELYLMSGINLSDGVLDVHRVTRNWAEGVDDGDTPTAPGATYLEADGFGGSPAPWTNPGGDFEATPVSSLTIPSLVVGFHQWDATALVSAWRDGTPNYGLLLRARSGVVEKVDFTSGDGALASRHPKLIITYACECGVTCGAPTVTPTTVLSTAGAAALGGMSFTRGDLVEYDPVLDLATILLDDSLLSASADIDAVHLLGNDHIVLSTNSEATLGGLTFSPGDLVEYDPVADTASIYLNHALFVDNGEDIDAVHLLDDGHIILSLKNTGSLGGMMFDKADLVEYDPFSYTATLYFSQSLFSGPANIDAVHVLADGHILLSTVTDATLGGLSFTPEDVVEYDPITDTATIYHSEPLFVTAENVDALHIVNGGGSVPPPPPVCIGILRDEFNSRSYSGSDGTLAWAGDWLEINESDGPKNGDIQVPTAGAAESVRVRDNDGGGEGIVREADLSAYSIATLSFAYRRDSLNDAGDYVTAEVSPDGGSTWTELGRFEGPNNDTAFESVTYDISAYIASNTQIRFLSSPSLGSNDQVYFDDVEICVRN